MKKFILFLITIIMITGAFVGGYFACDYQIFDKAAIIDSDAMNVNAVDVDCFNTAIAVADSDAKYYLQMPLSQLGELSNTTFKDGIGNYMHISGKSEMRTVDVQIIFDNFFIQCAADIDAHYGFWTKDTDFTFINDVELVISEDNYNFLNSANKSFKLAIRYDDVTTIIKGINGNNIIDRNFNLNYTTSTTAITDNSIDSESYDKSDIIVEPFTADSKDFWQSIFNFKYFKNQNAGFLKVITIFAWIVIVFASISILKLLTSWIKWLKK